MNRKKLIFTGGGSGGHVIPALVLIKELKKRGVEISYIGSEKAIESQLIPGEGINYYAIKTGKLRRYFSLENFSDLFRILWGWLQSIWILKKAGGRKNVLVFSTGGYISVPVGLACWLLGVDILIHEQTSRVGLANKIVSRFAKKIFVTFEDSLEFFPSSKTVVSGHPVRHIFFEPLSEQSVLIEGMDLNQSTKPLLVITGGGNGSLLINEKIREALEDLKASFDIVHQVGANFIDEYKQLRDNSYIPVAFLGEEMAFLYKKASIIVSRAGAGTVAELLAIGKPSIFIPLKIAQKNEQYHNAMEAHRRLGSMIIEEDEFKKCNLLKKLADFQKASPEASREKETVKEKATAFLVDEILLELETKS